MSGPPAPPFAGVHLPWNELPVPIQRWAAGVGGGPPDRVDDLSGGFSPGATARLRYSDGPDVFVKAVGAALNPDSPDIHRREAAIAALLPPSPMWPRLLQVYDDGDWVAMAFEAIDGRLPHCPWQPAELDSVVGALERMHQDLTPSPSSSIDTAAVFLQDTFNGWRLLASSSTPPEGLGGWSSSNLERLVALESSWPTACAGTTLIHCDIRSDNILVHAGGVVFVDWPHAAIASPVLDIVCWAPSVVLEGGPEPEELMVRYGPSRDADADAVTVMVATFAGFLTHRSLQPPPPGLPTLRAFQAAQGEVALAWLRRRTGW